MLKYVKFPKCFWHCIGYVLIVTSDVSINGLKDWLFSVLSCSTAKLLFGHYKFQINMLYKGMAVQFTWPICFRWFVTCTWSGWWGWSGCAVCKHFVVFWLYLKSIADIKILSCSKNIGRGLISIVSPAILPLTSLFNRSFRKRDVKQHTNNQSIRIICTLRTYQVCYLSIKIIRSKLSNMRP